MQIWFQEDFRNFWDACPWEEDLAYCQAVCERLGVSTASASRCLLLPPPCVHVAAAAAACRVPAWQQQGAALRSTMHTLRMLQVELRMVPLTEQYWDRVVAHCIAEIRQGRTPNPDVLCNSR